ncbi:IclR family transcriptional regulator [Nocardia jinanensis]|uniref:IclR family transcriptional regulator n=1 Tax=Nocardia jinanensis TaxID=382504 RepID=A0A917VRA7_9NOCA|nr:IclR family transcriptional regulator [Nocardia jinanensis]GGL10844.1 IclR family transcriptional regulator [Nocardia jinanensis]
MLDDNALDSRLPANAGALDRGLAILDYIALRGPSSTVDMGEALGLSRSTTYRLVDRLRESGWLAQDGPSGHWRLGRAAARLASAAVVGIELRDIAGPALRRLRNETQETVSLAVLNGISMVFIHRERGPRPVAVSDALGASRPLHSTSVGRAFLAGLPEVERTKLLDQLVLSPASPIDAISRGRLEAEIAATIERGWSRDLREFDESSCCCGAAIFDHTGLPVAAISVAGVAERMEKVIGEVGPLVVATARELSAELGYVPISV